MPQNTISIRIIEEMIFVIRGSKVMLDRDLAGLYGVSTKALNQAVKRNLKRFPADFMFRLNKMEKNKLVTECDRFNSLKHSTSNPLVFTEQGIAMLSSVLQSERAVVVNIQIMRAFVKLRELMLTHKSLASKIKKLEMKYKAHDEKILMIYRAIKKLLSEEIKPKKKIGFHP